MYDPNIILMNADVSVYGSTVTVNKSTILKYHSQLLSFVFLGKNWSNSK